MSDIWYVQPRANGRYSRVANQNGPANFAPGPEYDDPANCAPEEDQYGSQYGQYGAPYDHYGSRGSVSRRSVGVYLNVFVFSCVRYSSFVPITVFIRVCGHSILWNHLVDSWNLSFP